MTAGDDLVTTVWPDSPENVLEWLAYWPEESHLALFKDENLLLLINSVSWIQMYWYSTFDMGQYHKAFRETQAPQRL